MAFVKISEKELGEVGVERLDDQPALLPDAMKAKFEETAKQLLAPKINTLVEQLEAEAAAASLGAAVPTGLSEQTAKTVQAVLAALMAYIQEHENRKDNPHTVTAAQAGAYTKEETDSAINEKVVQIGAGDMQKAIYDPQGKSKDVFSYPAHLYKATFAVGKWSGGSQTATLTAMDGGPAVTASSVLYSGPMCEQTSVQATNEKLQDTLTIINAGNLTLGNGTLTAKIFESVTTDIEVIVQIKQGGA